MICSLSEIRSTLQKATVGTGSPTGTADDLASAGVWLCIHQLDGFRAILATLAGGPEQLVAVKANGPVLQLTGETARHWGVSPFQLLLAGDIETVEVNEVSAETGIALVGLAGVAAGAIERGFVLSARSHEPIVVSSQGIHGRHRLPNVGVDKLSIRLNENQDHHQPEQLDPPSGVQVDEQDWAWANRLAARTYVAATEHSRLRGAGAGLTDND